MADRVLYVSGNAGRGEQGGAAFRITGVERSG